MGSGEDAVDNALPDDDAAEKRHASPALTAGIRSTRHELDWKQPRLAEEMRTVAVRHGFAKLPETLITMISRWEDGWKVPSQRYRNLLAEAIGVQVKQLGLRADPDFARGEA
jgi:DNA-binding transcriptional regulator YiaG